MAHPTLDYAALSTLNLWLMTDSHIHEALQTVNREEKLAAIKRGASRFGYSRELESKYDAGVGFERFGPALDVIDELTAESISENTDDWILKVSRRISSKYGNNNVFSATTKLLWLKFRFPIIIYEQRAADALGAKLTRDYYDQWRARYDFHKRSVRDACAGLLNALRYVYDPSIATMEFVDQLATSNWFQHRVFRAYLTFMGRSAR